jgi:hypothetical protein
MGSERGCHEPSAVCSIELQRIQYSGSLDKTIV